MPLYPHATCGAGVVLPSVQRTLKAAIDCVGIGIHSGRRAKLTLRPAAPDTGVVFRRCDLGVDIQARFDAVVESQLCTTLVAPGCPEARVSTVEHVMAALAGCGVDNVIVDIDGAEVPILDGSAMPFVFLIDCAGIIEQAAPRRCIEVLRTIRVASRDAFVELQPARPGDATGLQFGFSIDFAATAIGCQSMALALNEGTFRTELAPARTFSLVQDVERMQAAGLARGGSLENAVVVDGAHVLNPGGLRMPDEFVRHKILDAVGDLALGGQLLGRYVGHRAGHALNNHVLRALFADPTAWRTAGSATVTTRSGSPLASAAAA
jgi:UDP-3-O-[3-hydroxymyristoyl] N-acetylglucosamine deacetylase